jgi:hypothetical protein
MFWKDAWLKPASGPGEARADDGLQALLERLPTRRDERYLCQSTALGEATAPLSRWDLSHLVVDLMRGDLGLFSFLTIAGRTLINLARRRFGLADLGMLIGPGAAAPCAALGLERGEAVRVRSREAIRSTLNGHGSAGGLSFEPEMGRYAGGRFEVDFAVRKIIHEETGRMVELKGTVALKGLTCQGSCVRNCPRANTLYWREAWLERADPVPAAAGARRQRKSHAQPAKRTRKTGGAAARKSGSR